MKMRGFIDWSVWFQRGLELQDHRAASVMAWVMAHADNQGSGWASAPKDYHAFGSEVGLSSDDFGTGLAMLIGYDLVGVSRGGSDGVTLEYFVDFNEKFEEDAA